MTDVIERTAMIPTWPAEALATLLDLPLPDLDGGAGLPLAWHWVYLLEHPAQRDLGRDGHPESSGIPSPPGPGRRRMWAGGRIRSLAPLRCGEPATRRSFVRRSVDKTGRTGKLTFVTVAHEITQNGTLAVAEEQDILYRDAQTDLGAPATPPTPADAGTGGRLLQIDPVLLFRFSALTYNGHRIHYDRDYAREVEGYPGLVVHGPLQALMMAEAARRGASGHEAARFEYRLVSPLFDFQGFSASAVGIGPSRTTRVADRTGRTTAIGRFVRDA